MADLGCCCALADRTLIEPRPREPPFLGFNQEFFSEFFFSPLLEERNARTAEAGPDQTGPQACAEILARIIEEVQLWTGNLVIVPQALVGMEQQVPQAGEIILLEGFHSPEDPPVFGNDVPGSLIRDWAHLCSGAFEKRRCCVLVCPDALQLENLKGFSR